VQTFVDNLAKWMGRTHLYQLAGGMAIAGGIALTLVLFDGLRDQAERRTLMLYWLLTLCLILGTWRVLTANNTELVHYPQYVPEGVALLAVTLSPVESLCWIALFGAIDEDYQYAVLHGTWGVPFDFNDVYMDLLGGALGILFAAAFLRCVPALPEPGFFKRLLQRPGVVMIFTLLVAGAALGASGKMLLLAESDNHGYWFALSRLKSQGFWFFDDTWGPHKFHTLLPPEGSALILLTIAAFIGFERRVRILPKP
jgi:hypothetical protein